MIADVVRNSIQWSIVRVRFLTFFEHVVFGDEVSRDRMQRETQRRAQEEVSERLAAEEVEHGHVEGQNDEEIDDLQHVDRFREDEHRPKRVEQRHDQQKDHFAQSRREEEHFETCRHVGVVHAIALESTQRHFLTARHA